MSHPNFVERASCPACSSVNFKKIYESAFTQSPIKNYLDAFYNPQGGVEYEYLEGASYKLYECNDCELLFQKDILNDKGMERLYDHWIDPNFSKEKYAKKDSLSRSMGYASEIAKIIAYFNRKPNTLRLFDFGMGWANWALMAKAFGCQSYGTDLSQERIANATSLGINVITWDEIPGQEFDFINTEQVFEHIPKPLETMLHLQKGLKVGGVIKIGVPTANDIHKRLKIMDWSSVKGGKNSLNAVAPLEHINCFNRKSLATMAKKAGLEEVLIPLHIQYRYLTDWKGIKNTYKHLRSPLNANVFKNVNYAFFKKI